MLPSAVSEYAEQEQQTSAGDEGKTRRLKKKKKKQKKKTHSVDSGVSKRYSYSVNGVLSPADYSVNDSPSACFKVHVCELTSITSELK